MSAKSCCDDACCCVVSCYAYLPVVDARRGLNQLKHEFLGDALATEEVLPRVFDELCDAELFGEVAYVVPFGIIVGVQTKELLDYVVGAIAWLVLYQLMQVRWSHVHPLRLERCHSKSPK